MAGHRAPGIRLSGGASRLDGRKMKYRMEQSKAPIVQTNSGRDDDFATLLGEYATVVQGQTGCPSINSDQFSSDCLER